jgi:uncharacterized membrane protein
MSVASMAEARVGARERGRTNVGKAERYASLAAGALLAGAGVRKGGWRGALLALGGAMLVERGATGHCRIYGALGLDTSRDDARGDGGGTLAAGDHAGVSITTAVSINRPADELYRLWRDFTRAPRYMERVVSVQVIDATRSRWTASGPMGRTWTWDSRITEDRPGVLIAWESLPGSDLANRGAVRFIPTGRPGVTEVRYTLELDPPGGIIGQALAGVFHDAPQELATGDLRRFRELAESGETFTAGGQPSGREG